MADKYDAVVEAVHFGEDGQVDWVRVYERRGAVFSDRSIWKRDRLVERLKKGASVRVGKRIYSLGNSFEVGDPLKLLESNGSSVIVTGDLHSDRDSLDSTPRI